MMHIRITKRRTVSQEMSQEYTSEKTKKINDTALVLYNVNKFGDKPKIWQEG